MDRGRRVVTWLLAIFLFSVFISAVSYAEDKENRMKEGVAKREKKERKMSPAFVYDEASKKYILDTKGFTAEFAPSNFTYVPKIEGVKGKPFTFTLEGIYQGEEKIFPADEQSVNDLVDGESLSFKRKDYEEHYESLRGGFLQGWTIKTPPKAKDKDLIIKARLSTEYTRVPEGEKGFSLKDGDEIITAFRQPVVFDANSKKLSLKTVLKGDILEITLPKDYIAEAEFPVVVNPPRPKRAGGPAPAEEVKEKPPVTQRPASGNGKEDQPPVTGK